MKDTRLGFRFIVGLATEIGALAAATSYVAAHQGFGRGDLPALAFWSVPLMLGLALLLPRLARRFSTAGAAVTSLVMIAAGIFAGLLWSIAAALILGPWIAAFSFPLLFVWTAGGLLGGVTAAAVLRPGSWAIAVTTVLLASFGMRRVDTYRPPPESAIRVVLVPNATAGQVDEVLTAVLSRRTGRGDEHYFLPGVSSMGGAPREGTSPVIVAQFERGTSQRTRDHVIAIVRRSPLVLRVDVDTTREGRF